MTETTRRREATRQRLVDAAITEFAARGIDATSVEQLCEAAGFTRGAFYSNFETRDDLCIAVLEHHRDMVVDGLAQTFAEPPPGADVEWVTGQALQELFRIIAPSPEFRTTLMEINLRSIRTPELAERARELRRQVRPGLVRLVDDLAEAVGVEFRIPTSNVIETFEAIFFHWFAEPGDGVALTASVATALAVRKGSHG